MTQREQDILTLYFNRIKNFEPLDAEEEKSLIEKAQKGNINARNKVVTANLKFVVKIAKNYQKSGVPLMDLISEGNLGLIESVEHFDITQNSKFITYAVWWIKQSIIKYLQDKSRPIRIPNNKNVDLAEINKKIEEYRNDNKVVDLAKIADELKMDRNTVKSLIDITTPCLSLDSSIRVDDENSVNAYDLISSEYETTEEESEKEDLRRYTEKYIRKLPDRIQKVIRMRYGFTEFGDEMSLQDIGEILNLTKERVRQLENEGLMQLRELMAS